MDILSAGVQKRIELAPKLVRPIFESEWRRLLKYEHIIFDYFENHCIISAQDREQLMHQRKHTVHVLPNGVDNYFLNYENATITKDFDLCFVGNLNYPPNIQAVKFIVNELLPEFKRRGKQIKVLISGVNPSAEILSYSNQVTITGWVDDIRESYTRSRVFVAPMFIGTGLQNKLLEALALGLPCVTTPLAHKPLNCTEDIVAKADSPEAFAKTIIELLEDCENPEKRKLRKSFVQQHFDWKEINQNLSEMMSEKL
jgi:glycosyltransferase involved in cell wall biosynthesis